MSQVTTNNKRCPLLLEGHSFFIISILNCLGSWFVCLVVQTTLHLKQNGCAPATINVHQELIQQGCHENTSQRGCGKDGPETTPKVQVNVDLNKQGVFFLENPLYTINSNSG